jgi:hypothetical protein
MFIVFVHMYVNVMNKLILVLISVSLPSETWWSACSINLNVLLCIGGRGNAHQPGRC